MNLIMWTPSILVSLKGFEGSSLIIPSKGFFNTYFATEKIETSLIGGTHERKPQLRIGIMIYGTDNVLKFSDANYKTYEKTLYLRHQEA